MEVIRAGSAGSSGFLDASGDLVTTLLHAANIVRQRLVEFLERFELTEGRYLTLEALSRAGARGLSQSEVADYLVQSESNVSSLIHRLQRDGLVDRSWSVTDRRKRVLLLTESGQQLIDRVSVARMRWEEALLSRISPQEHSSLLEGLRLIGKQTGPTVMPRPPVSNVTERVDWPGNHSVKRCDPASPHFALEQMLSTLGLAGRFGEGEQ
ncbi:MAG TPA: MarR family transcriptional regulator [Schlesneria sp.]|jgi:DNA-binding MarR family transcriptional regulator